VDDDIGPDETVTTNVVRAVSTVEGRDVCSLPSLAEVLDPAALDTSFEPRSNVGTRIGGKVSFLDSDCVGDVEGESLSVELLGATGPAGGTEHRVTATPS